MARVCEFFGNGPPLETKVATSHPASPAPMLLKLNLGSSKDLVAGTAQPKTQAIKQLLTDKTSLSFQTPLQSSCILYHTQKEKITDRPPTGFPAPPLFVLCSSLFASFRLDIVNHEGLGSAL